MATVVKKVWAKVDNEASKKVLRSGHTLSVGEICALVILVGCMIMYNRPLFKNLKFIVPFVILVVAMVLW